MRATLRWTFYFACTLLWVVAIALCLILVDTFLVIRATVAKHSMMAGSYFAIKGDIYESHHPSMVHQEFLKKKPENGYRVFVLGASAAMGTPYVNQDRRDDFFLRLLGMKNEGGISTWLQEYLTALHPDRRIEVINAAVGGQNMCYVADVYSEVVTYQPDLLLVFEANNDHTLPFKRDGSGPSFDQLRSDAIKSYRMALHRMSELASQKKVLTIFMTVPSNIRDWMPTDIELISSAELSGLLARGEDQQVVERLDHHPAIKTNALLMYFLAKAYDHQKKFDLARQFYIAARDSCKSSPRAPTWLNNEIRAIPITPYTRVLDIENIIIQKSKDQIPGLDIFHDFCHFRLAYYKLIAFEVLRSLGEDPATLSSAHLSDVSTTDLRKLYWLKLIQWYRWNYIGFLESTNLFSQQANAKGVIGDIVKHLRGDYNAINSLSAAFPENAKTH